MDISNIIVLSLIVSAFVVFAGTLMWADYHTRQLSRPTVNTFETTPAIRPATDRKAA